MTRSDCQCTHPGYPFQPFHPSTLEYVTTSKTLHLYPLIFNPPVLRSPSIALPPKSKINASSSQRRTPRNHATKHASNLAYILVLGPTLLALVLSHIGPYSLCSVTPYYTTWTPLIFPSPLVWLSISSVLSGPLAFNLPGQPKYVESCLLFFCRTFLFPSFCSLP